MMYIDKDKRLIFGEDVKNYEKWRPRYCEELFQNVFQYSGISANSNVIEIGCGTGQATEPFLQKGCNVHAIELSETMYLFTRKKYSKFPNFEIDNASFEECKLNSESVDLLFAATSFHWIEEEIGYVKAKDILKPGGSIALFWNHPYVGREFDTLHQEIQKIYTEYEDKGYKPKKKKPIENDVQQYLKIDEKLIKYGFSDVSCEIYRKTRTFTSKEYIYLLNTYSDHRNMESEARKAFEKDIISAIDAYGGILNVYDTMDLHLAKKN